MSADPQSPLRGSARGRTSPLRRLNFDLRDPSAHAGVPDPAGPGGGRITGGGTRGNERLTAATGILLVILLAVIGVTIVRLGPLISVHLFVGLVLIPVVGLKLASTGYRFVRYYTADPVYRERGAPPILLRMSAPVLVATSVSVLATGVALLLIGPESSGTLRLLHKASFIVWVAFMTLHVVGHLPDMQKTFLTRRGERVEYNRHAAGATGRIISIVGALVAGVVLAIVLIPHFGAWTNFEAFRHHH
ncbi:MAG TPA: hypothetical protein VIJ50_05365 [Solirubrobacteraceae bacterium]